MRYVVTATITVETDGTEGDALEVATTLLPLGMRVRDGAAIIARLDTVTHATATQRVHRNLRTGEHTVTPLAKLGGA